MDCIIKKSHMNMHNLCFTCLEKIPTPAADQTQNDTQYSVKLDKNIINILHMNTGIAYNINKDKYPKQLCKKCYMKILDFEEFHDMALCCATALHQLLLEEHFTITTLNNLKYFCCLCLTKMQTLNETSNHLNNIEIIRWMQECNQLKDSTAIEQWPTSVCDSCCAKLNDLIVFESIAKESLKQLENELGKPENNDTEKRETRKNQFEIELRSEQNTEEEEQCNTELLEKTDKYTIVNDKVVNKLEMINAEQSDPIEKQFDLDAKTEEAFIRHLKTKKTKKGKKRGKKIKIRSKKEFSTEDAPLTTCNSGVIEPAISTLKTQMECEESLMYLNNLKISDDSEICDNNKISTDELIPNASATPMSDVEIVGADKHSAKEDISLATNNSLDSSIPEASNTLFVAPRATRLKRKIVDINGSNNEPNTAKHKKSIKKIPPKLDVLVENSTNNYSVHPEDIGNSNDIVMSENETNSTILENTAVVIEKHSAKNTSRASKKKKKVTKLKSDPAVETPTNDSIHAEDLGNENGAELSENTLDKETNATKNIPITTNKPALSDETVKNLPDVDTIPVNDVDQRTESNSVQVPKDDADQRSDSNTQIPKNDSEISVNTVSNKKRSGRKISKASKKITKINNLPEVLLETPTYNKSIHAADAGNSHNTVMSETSPGNEDAPENGVDQSTESNNIEVSKDDVKNSEAIVSNEKLSTKVGELKSDQSINAPTNDSEEDVGNSNEEEMSENALENQTSTMKNISTKTNMPTRPDVIVENLPGLDTFVVDEVEQSAEGNYIEVTKDDADERSETNVEIPKVDDQISENSIPNERRSTRNISKASKKLTKTKKLLETSANNESIHAEDVENINNDASIYENALDNEISSTKNTSITSNEPTFSNVIVEYCSESTNVQVPKDDADQRIESNAQIPKTNSEISENTVSNKKRSGRKISKASKNITKTNNLPKPEILFETPTYNKSINAEDTGNSHNIVMSETAPGNEDVPEDGIDHYVEVSKDDVKNSHNIVMSETAPANDTNSTIPEDGVDQSTESNNVEVSKDDVKNSEAAVSNEKRSTKIAELKSDQSIDAPTNDSEEDVDNSNEEEMSENALENETSTMKNISTKTNMPTRPDVIVENLPGLDTFVVDEVEQSAEGNYIEVTKDDADERSETNVEIPKVDDQISENSIPNERRSTRNISKASKKLTKTKKLLETFANNESIHAEDVENINNDASIYENALESTNVQVPKDDADQRIESNAQIPKTNSEISENTVSNKKRSGRKISKASKNITKTNNLRKPEILFETPTYNKSINAEDAGNSHNLVMSETTPGNEDVPEDGIDQITESNNVEVSKDDVKNSHNIVMSETAPGNDTNSTIPEDGVDQSTESNNVEVSKDDVKNYQDAVSNEKHSTKNTSRSSKKKTKAAELKSDQSTDAPTNDSEEDVGNSNEEEISENALENETSTMKNISIKTNTPTRLDVIAENLPALDTVAVDEVEQSPESNYIEVTKDDADQGTECNTQIPIDNAYESSETNVEIPKVVAQISENFIPNEKRSTRNISKASKKLTKTKKLLETSANNDSIHAEDVGNINNDTEIFENALDNETGSTKNTSITSNEPTFSNVIVEYCSDINTNLVDDVDQGSENTLQGDAQISENLVSNLKRSAKNTSRASKKKIKVAKLKSDTSVETATNESMHAEILFETSAEGVGNMNDDTEISESALDNETSSTKNISIRSNKPTVSDMIVKCCSNFDTNLVDDVDQRTECNAQIAKDDVHLSENTSKASKRNIKIAKLKADTSVEPSTNHYLHAEDLGNSNDEEMSDNGLDNDTSSTRNISITTNKPEIPDVIVKCLPDLDTILVDNVDPRTESNNVQIPTDNVEILKNSVSNEERSAKNIEKTSKKKRKVTKLPKSEILVETPENAEDVTQNISITSNKPTVSEVTIECCSDIDKNLVDNVDQRSESNAQTPKDDAQVAANSIPNEKRLTRSISKASHSDVLFETLKNNESTHVEGVGHDVEMSENGLDNETICTKNIPITSNEPTISDATVEGGSDIDTNLVEVVEERTKSNNVQMPKNEAEISVNTVSSKKRSTKDITKALKRNTKVTKPPKSEILVETATLNDATIVEDVSQKTTTNSTQNSETFALNEPNSTKKASKVKIKKSKRSSKLVKDAAAGGKNIDDDISRNTNLEVGMSKISISMSNNPENLDITQTLIDSTLIENQGIERRRVSSAEMAMSSNGKFVDTSTTNDSTHEVDVDLLTNNNDSGALAENLENERSNTIYNDDETSPVNTVSDQPSMDMNISKTLNEKSSSNNITELKIETSTADDIGQVAQNKDTDISENLVGERPTSTDQPNQPEKLNTLDETSTAIDSNNVQNESSQTKDTDVTEISEGSFENNVSHTTKDELKSSESVKSSKMEEILKGPGLEMKNSDVQKVQNSDSIDSTFILEENVEATSNAFDTKLSVNCVLNESSAIKDISKMTDHVESTSTKLPKSGLLGESATVLEVVDLTEESTTNKISKISNNKLKSNKSEPSKSNTFVETSDIGTEDVAHKSKDCDAQRSEDIQPNRTKLTSSNSTESTIKTKCLIDNEGTTRNTFKVSSSELKSKQAESDSNFVEDVEHKSKDCHSRSQPSSTNSKTKSTKDHSYSSESDWDSREASPVASLVKKSMSSSSKHISKSLNDRWSSRKPVRSNIFDTYGAPSYSRHAVERGHKGYHKPSTEGSSMYSQASSSRNISMSAYNKYGSRESQMSYDSKYRNERSVSPVSRYNTMQRHIYETHEMSPNSYRQYSMQHGYQCRVCMKVFKHRGQLNHHLNYSPRCVRR